MLTVLQCRNAKAGAKACKLYDAGGLYLFVSTTGFRSWRLKYRWQGKEKTLVFGAYGEGEDGVSLTRARDLRDEAKRALRAGRDPAVRSTAPTPAGPTFEAYARRWHEDQAVLWRQGHADQVLHSLETNVFPAIGPLPIGDVRPAQVKELLLAIQARGAIDGAHRIRGRISSIFARAIAEELAEIDPAAAIGAVLRPAKSGRMGALVTLEQARAFLRAAEAQAAQPAVRLISRLIALTACRPGMARLTPRTGEFIDLAGKDPVWHVPAARMKLEREESEQAAFDFLMPLSRQAVDVIRIAQAHAGRAPWLFPGAWNAHRPLSDNTVSKFYRRLTASHGKHVPHGWRSTFSSVMNERAARRGRSADADVIELMLAHRPQGVRGIYNRASHMARRRKLAQEWADLLLEGFEPASSLLVGARH